jgi:hypothetical protein
MLNNTKVTISATTKATEAKEVALSTTAVIKRANELVKAREKFETETLARSNKELYGILSEVYDLFTNASKDLACLKETVKEMKAGLSKRNVKVQSNSPALTVFVRYVFNSDRKRAYNYTRTLMAAIQANTPLNKFSEFIESKGGVEECKKNFVKKIETVQKELAIKEATAEMTATLQTMEAEEVVHMSDSSVHFSDGCDFVYVIARQTAKDKLELLRVIPKTTKALENSAIKELAKDLIEKRATAKDAGKASKKDVATAKAVSSMSVKQVEMA